MKLPHRRQFPHLAAGAAALPAVSRFAIACGPSLPTRVSNATASAMRSMSYAPPAPPSCRHRPSLRACTASARSHAHAQPSAILASR